MANFSGGYILTQKGEALQAQVEAGKLLLNLTKFQIGNGTTNNIQDYYTRDTLINPINNLTIASKEAMTIGDQSACVVKATLVNNAVDSGYMASEMGLFANDADGNEILFAVSYDENPSYIASKEDGTEITMNFQFILLISGADKITLTMPYTQAELAAMVQDKAIAAADSATAAAKSATSAADHETAAKVAQGKAEDAQAGAEVAQKGAAASATASANSATAAAASEKNAASSQSAAATSATAAAGSATAAGTSEKNAAASATAAKTSETNAATSLAAAQKAQKECESLKGQVDVELAKAVKMAKYCGSVDTYAALPTSPSLGDVYNVVQADTTHSIKAGDNVIWTGSAWDNLSGLVDLSDYYTKQQVKDVITQALAGKIVSATVTDGVLDIH